MKPARKGSCQGRPGSTAGSFKAGATATKSPPAPLSSQACAHSGLLQCQPAALGSRWGAPGASAAGHTLRSRAGVLPADAPSTHRQSRQRNLPAMTVDPRWTELPHNPRPAPLSKRGLHTGPTPDTEHARLRQSPRLHPQQLRQSTSRASASGEGHRALLQPLQLRTQQEHLSPPSTPRRATAAGVPARCSLQMAAAPGSCLQPQYRCVGFCVNSVCAALCRSSPAPLTISLFSGKSPWATH